MNINLRSIFVFVGYLVLFTAVLMVVPLVIEIINYKTSVNKDLDIWLFMVVILGFLGVLIVFSSKINIGLQFSAKDSLIITLVSWVLFAILASLPFYFTSLRLSFIDAFFESTSGITTTGASIINNLDNLNTSLHVWRIMLGWVGSVGIIVTAVIVLPSTQSSGKLFKNEAFETFDNTLDKAKKLAFGVLFVYSLLTVLSFFSLLYLGKLNVLDAFIHAMSSISATGFSNKNYSAGEFNSYIVNIILIISMLTSGVPYVFLYYLVFYRRLNLFKDEQVKGYFKLIIMVTVIIIMWLFFKEHRDPIEYAIPILFTVVSLTTGTGLTVVDYTTFGLLPSMMLLVVMIIGGCAGSKTAGIKIYRVQMSFMFIKNNIIKLYLPKHIKVPLYNGKVVSYETANNVFAYIFLYFVVVFIIAIIVSGTGLDFTTSFTAAIATVSNVGPAFGQIVGPTGNYYLLTDFAKLTLIGGMILGRLEIFVIIVVFTKRFWQV